MNLLNQLREQMPEYARDIKLNLGSILSTEGAPGLTINQIFGAALATAYATKNTRLIAVIEQESSAILSDAEQQAAKAASVIMAMNNIYYRFTHFAENDSLSKLPARLRMNVIGKPGIEKLDFEIYSLAVSAYNGCEMCVKSHIHEVQKAGLSIEGVQSVARIAATISATAQAVSLLD